MSKIKGRSIGDLFARNKRDLLGFLTRRVGRERASDLLQETFLRALGRVETDAVVDADAYLRTMAINLVRDHARQCKTEAKYFTSSEIPEEIVDADLNPLEHYELTDRTRLLFGAIEALPPKCRQVFVLRRFHDLSHEEIAERLGISRNMVEKHLRLALERCRAALD